MYSLLQENLTNRTLTEFCSSKELCLTWSLFLFQFSKLVLVDIAICVSFCCFLRHEVYPIHCCLRGGGEGYWWNIWCHSIVFAFQLSSCIFSFLIHFANCSLYLLTLLPRSWIGTIHFSPYSSKLLKSSFGSLPHSISTKSNYNFSLLSYASSFVIFEKHFSWFYLQVFFSRLLLRTCKG